MILPILVAAVQIINPYANVQPGAVSVIVAGQSNAQGMGSIDAELDDIPNVFVIRRKGLFYTSHEPLSGAGGYGFARSFARAYMRDHIVPQLYIIQCAVSGSYMSNWLVGNNVPSFYEPCIDLVHESQQAGINPIAILWLQGESDSIKGNTSYGTQLNSLILQFLSDVDDIPFIAGELPKFLLASKFPFRNSIVLQTINNTKSAGRGFAKSDGLTSNADGVHFNHESQDILGGRYESELLRLEIQ